MGKSVTLAETMKIFLGIFSTILLINHSYTDTRQLKQLSLFSVVQFPNDECTSSTTSPTTMGTCLTSSECTSRSGTGSGSCAAGFGVCCVVSTSTCGASVSTNITYIRNPGYPSSYTPTSAGTCSFTIDKASDDICQLRLDFETMSGYTATTAGACTASFQATGQAGKNPPAICGTNTDYHMYVEFGASATDSITLQHTLDATQKSWNILARQISCTASWKAPTDCVQYFTGVSGNVKSYNFAGSQILQSQNYNNCMRQEMGYCRIQWQQNAATSPDPFQLDTDTTGSANAAGGIVPANPTPTAAIAYPCLIAYVKIPDGSLDGITAFPSGLMDNAFQNQFCGADLGITVTPPVTPSVSSSIISATTPFTLGVWTATAALASGPAASGFSLDYTQLPC